MSLELSVREMSGVSIVDVSGRLTLGDNPSELRDMLRELAIGGHGKILLNLGDLSQLDSSGIGMLVSSFATITNLGGQLKLLNLNRRVRDLLLMTKLYSVFEVYEDEPAAMGSFIEPAVAAPTTPG